MKLNLDELEARIKTGAIKKFTSGIYTGWCYTQKCQYYKMWDEYTRIARGVITVGDGVVIARPFTKFFNLGEPETGVIPWHEPIEVTEKIDGSLIVVSSYNGNIIINTKGGFSNEYTDFARRWLMDTAPDWHPDPRYTYCFEAVFPEINPDNTKIINYGDRADLTLLAQIDRESGTECTYNDLTTIGGEWGFPVAPRHTFDDIDALISRCRTRKIDEGEGVVLRFTESNLRIKVKSEEFLRLNRLISHTSEKHILESLANGDDVERIFASLPDELFEEVQETVNKLCAEYDAICNDASRLIPYLEKIPTRKEQAMYIVQNFPHLKGVLFAMLDYKDHSKIIWDMMKNNRQR